MSVDRVLQNPTNNNNLALTSPPHHIPGIDVDLLKFKQDLDRLDIPHRSRSMQRRETVRHERVHVAAPNATELLVLPELLLQAGNLLLIEGDVARAEVEDRLVLLPNSVGRGEGLGGAAARVQN